MSDESTRQATRTALELMLSSRQPDHVAHAAFGPTEPCISVWDHPCPAAMFWKAFVDAGGLPLDPALWKVEAGAKDGVSKIVETALVRGLDSSRAHANFMFETSERHDWMRVHDDYLITPCYSISDAIGDLLLNAINRSHLAIQVLQGIADLSELDRLDEPVALPECHEEGNDDE